MAVLRLSAELTNLEPLRQFVIAQAEELAMPLAFFTRIELVLEELVVNVATHAYGDGAGDVEVLCQQEAGPMPGEHLFCMYIRDWSHAFNPLVDHNPDLTTDAESRAIGGLGLHFVREMTDYCEYTRKDNCNEVRICFRMS